MPVVQTLAIFLLMTVFAQALLALVRGDFVTFAFFSARHNLDQVRPDRSRAGYKFL